MKLTKKFIESLHSGHVLHRVGKKKYRVVKPISHNTCDSCTSNIAGNVVKLEGGGNITFFTFCPSCAIEELEELEE